MNEERYELKVCAQSSRYLELRSRAQFLGLGFREQYPERWVNSLYFDSEQYSAYQDNLSGMSRRAKLRLRWYGDLERSRTSQLELKQRRAGLGTKHSQTVSFSNDLHRLSHSAILNELQSKVVPEFLPILHSYSVPSMLVRYCREYFVSACRKLRLTLDRELQVYAQLSSAELNIHFQSVLEPRSILEIKAGASEEKLLEQVLRELPPRISKSSKYAAGIEAMLFETR